MEHHKQKLEGSHGLYLVQGKSHRQHGTDESNESSSHIQTHNRSSQVLWSQVCLHSLLPHLLSMGFFFNRKKVGRKCALCFVPNDLKGCGRLDRRPVFCLAQTRGACERFSRSRPLANSRIRRLFGKKEACCCPSRVTPSRCSASSVFFGPLLRGSGPLAALEDHSLYLFKCPNHRSTRKSNQRFTTCNR